MTTTKIENKGPILYLAQAYSKYPQPQFKDCLGHEAFDKATDWVQMLWDLGFEVFSPIMYTHPFHCVFNYPDIDYVAHDLKMLESWCLPTDKTADRMNVDSNLLRIVENGGYQPNVVCVFADDCFTSHPYLELGCMECTEKKVLFWASKGAKMEYDFAHAHHIKCIRLAELLEKKSIERCESF